jgi:hypothetical protein
MATQEFAKKIDDELNDAFYKSQNMQETEVYYVETISASYLIIFIAMVILFIVILLLCTQWERQTIKNAHLTGIWKDASVTPKIIFPTDKSHIKVVTGDNIQVYNGKIENDTIMVEDYPVEGSCEPLTGKIENYERIKWNIGGYWLKD